MTPIEQLHLVLLIYVLVRIKMYIFLNVLISTFLLYFFSSFSGKAFHKGVTKNWVHGYKTLVYGAEVDKF